MSALSFALKIAVVGAGCAAVAVWLPRDATTTTPTNEVLGAVPAATGGPRTARADDATERTSIEPAEIVVEAGQQISATPAVLRSPAAQTKAALKAGNPIERRELVIALQRELVRVGCYGSSPTGNWTPGSKRAMAHFIESVNASLPAEEPDYILLSLVQNQKEPACQERQARPVSLQQQAEAPREALETEPWRLGAGVRSQQQHRSQPVFRYSFRPTNDRGWRQRVFESR